MVDGTRMKNMEERLAKRDTVLDELNEQQRAMVATQNGIQRTLEQILDRLTHLERSPNRGPEIAQSGNCVRSIHCECVIRVGSEDLNYNGIGCCVRSIDCECDICIRSDATSPGSEGLKYDETEANQPSDFHVLDDPQVELDSPVLGCTRELNLSSVCFNAWLECEKFKTTKVAPYLFDKMVERNGVYDNSLVTRNVTIQHMLFTFPFDPGSNMLMMTSSNPLLDFSNNYPKTLDAAKLIERIVHLNAIPWNIANSSYMKALSEERAWKCVILKFPANVKKFPCVDIETRHLACWEEALRALCYNLPMDFVERLLVEASVLQLEKNRLFDDVSGTEVTKFMVSWKDGAKHVLINWIGLIGLEFDVVPMAFYCIFRLVPAAQEASCGLLQGLRTLSFAATTPPLHLLSWIALFALIVMRQNQRNEKLQLTSIIIAFVLEELWTIEGYISLIKTISAIIQLEKSFMLAYTTVEYSTLTNGCKEVTCLVGLMKALENIEGAKCQFGMVPSFHQIDWCSHSSYIQFSSKKMQSDMRKNKRQPCLIVMPTAPYMLFPFDPGGSSYSFTILEDKDVFKGKSMS